MLYSFSHRLQVNTNIPINDREKALETSVNVAQKQKQKNETAVGPIY